MSGTEVSASTVLYRCVCARACGGFNLELVLAAWIQRFLVEELEVPFVSVQFSLSSGFFCSGETLQQRGLQSADVTVHGLTPEQNVRYVKKLRNTEC